jgi:hypothetical protein
MDSRLRGNDGRGCLTFCVIPEMPHFKIARSSIPTPGYPFARE